jgi:hypothetical protein
MTAVDDYLTRLFRRAQNAVSRGKDHHVSLPISRAQFPAYVDTRDFAEAQEYRAQLTLAERKGAVALHRNERNPQPRDVESVSVLDLKALAEHLHLPLRAEQTGRAQSMLGRHISAFPVLESMISTWERGKKVRGHDPSEPTLQAIVDAVAVMLSRHLEAGEVLLRRESTRLFNDSKRLEKLGKWLDVLLNNDVAPSGLMDAEVFSALGLLKEPQPFLISTAATAHGDEVSSLLFRPYQGLPMEAVRGFTFEVGPSCVLSVENKQTFHEIAALATGSTVCAIYSGGMPSPTWHRVYASLLSAIPSSTVVYHFGDLDVGGFRIAHAIAQAAKASGHTLQPWMMDPIELQSIGHALYPATESQIAEMRLWCQRIGWTSIGNNLAIAPGLLEQEAVHPALPS